MLDPEAGQPEAPAGAPERIAPPEAKAPPAPPEPIAPPEANAPLESTAPPVDAQLEPIEPLEPVVPPSGAPPEGPPANPAEPVRGYLPFVAYPGAVVAQPAPAPTWTRAYELPSARRVVSSGLQLAVDASKPVRRASIYIGLLALGAFGPSIVLLLIGIGRLMSDPGMADTITNDPGSLFIADPEIVGPILLIYALLLIGSVLLVAISIDAQAIAISILAGRASDRPMQLFEAITRARQVFWRLLGASFLVGIASYVIQLIITLPFLRPNDSNQGLTFIALAVATLVLSPFAFAATGIVLGDVGPIESLRRSMALFRARKRIALTVAIFTLVTAAIQSFALGAGVDVAVRVGDVMHLSLNLGGIGLVVATVIVLAVVMAFGSLTFTIAAIVAAPQVAAFLGLTYYSGGLDRARSANGVRPRRFRWVSVPMALVMVALLVLAGFGLPTVVGIKPPAQSSLAGILAPLAHDHSAVLSPLGVEVDVPDQSLDGTGANLPWMDITSAGYAYLPDVPAWLLDSMFACGTPTVSCSDPTPESDAWDEGAFLFVERMAAAPDAAQPGERREWGPIFALSGTVRAPLAVNSPLAGASHAFITSAGTGRYVVQRLEYTYGDWKDVLSNTRSAWVGSDLLTLIPLSEDLPVDPVRWDAYASLVQPAASSGWDELRSSSLDLSPAFDEPPIYESVPVP